MKPNIKWKAVSVSEDMVSRKIGLDKNSFVYRLLRYQSNISKKLYRTNVKAPKAPSIAKGDLLMNKPSSSSTSNETLNFDWSKPADIQSTQLTQQLSRQPVPPSLLPPYQHISSVTSSVASSVTSSVASSDTISSDGTISSNSSRNSGLRQNALPASKSLPPMNAFLETTLQTREYAACFKLLAKTFQITKSKELLENGLKIFSTIPDIARLLSTVLTPQQLIGNINLWLMRNKNMPYKDVPLCFIKYVPEEFQNQMTQNLFDGGRNR
jgi:hypothetical protein